MMLRAPNRAGRFYQEQVRHNLRGFLHLKPSMGVRELRRNKLD
jgi:hypothetical protein